MPTIDELVKQLAETIAARNETEIRDYMLQHMRVLPANEEYTRQDVTHFVVASIKVAKLYEKAWQAHTNAHTINAMSSSEWRRAADDYEKITGVSSPVQLVRMYLALERQIISNLSDAVDELYPRSRVKGERLIEIMRQLPVIAGVLGRLDAAIKNERDGVKNYLDFVEISIKPSYNNAGGKG
ncbi:hypothetical protein HYW19_01310 [Candidatus Woesearchaeota archaeon]|nr:hypothetical protein [Candidatus Woesearchaeota archaeon]